MGYVESLERKNAELEAKLARAQMNLLRAQLPPHFLFNSLNVISALMYEDIEKADATMTQLSDLLRMTLENSEQQEVSLRQELEFLDRFLAIAKARFGSHLEVEYDVDQTVLDALVPNLVLLPLVENAIRHALNSGRGRGRIKIAAGLREGFVRLEVLDNGPGFDSVTVRGGQMGIGLSNTRRRLEYLYGSAQLLETRNQGKGGAVVRVQIPFHVGIKSQVERRLEDRGDNSHRDRRRRAIGA